MSSESAREELAAGLPADDSTRPSQDALSFDEMTPAADEPLSTRFTALFDQHADAIFNYCYRRTGNRSDAEDLLSAVFLTAWKRGTRMPRGRELPWLYGIAANVIRNHRRSQRRLERLRIRLMREPAAEDRPTSTDEAIHIERMVRALDTLRPTERDVFILCTWQDLSYEDTAQALGIPVGTVRSSLSRARKKLRELFEASRT